MMANRTRGARGGFDLNRTLGQSPRHRLADSAATPKEKTLLAFLICAGWIFSEKRKGCFSFGVATEANTFDLTLVIAKFSHLWQYFLLEPLCHQPRIRTAKET